MSSLLVIIPLWAIAFYLRMLSGKRSTENERRLRAEGATEYGSRTTAVIIVLHLTYYVGSLAEACIRRPSPGLPTAIGAGLMAFSILSLYWVIRTLGPLWTGKLLIARAHPVNRSWLFRHIRHPNYLLNVIPELIALTLICHAWVVGLVLFPAYMVCLGLRISQEERAMAALPGWGK
jgi:isoprenylcysteine carboxyl methyltransferase (ICMT) family protein YpbQ